MAQQARDLVEDHQPRRVADGNHQRVRLLFYRHEVVAEHQLDRHGAQQVVLNLEVFQVNEFGVIARGQKFRLVAFFLRAWKRANGHRNRYRMCRGSHVY